MKTLLICLALIGLVLPRATESSLFPEVQQEEVGLDATIKGNLREGATESHVISPGQKHRFEIELGKEHFAFLRLNQNGIDLTIQTSDAAGEKLGTFDSPNGKNGPELVMLKATSAGKFFLEVTPLDAKGDAGSYDLAVVKTGPKPVELAEEIDLLFLPWQHSSSPGVAVAVSRNGNVVFNKGYGSANLEYEIPITPKSVFHVASVSKQFTIFSILLLESEGKLSLDDDIRKHLPEVPDFGTPITLRHLASHTSGLRDQWALLEMAGWRSDDVITQTHILKLVSRQKRLNFDPGEEFSYSNTGFTLLAEVVARVSGQSFAEFTQHRIFQPLEMEQTLFYDDHTKIVPNRAYSYQDTGELRKSVLNFANVGATSLFTTAEDLTRWAINYSSLKIGNAEIFDQMQTLHKLNNGETFGGGFGLFIGKHKGLNEIQHSGGDAGYRSFLTRFPDQGLTVAILSNSAEVNPVDLAHKVVDIYLGKEILEADAGQTIKKNENASPAKSIIVVEPATLDKYVGEYEVTSERVFKVFTENEQLFVQSSDRTRFELIAQTQTMFSVEGLNSVIEFESVDGADAKVKSERLFLTQGNGEKLQGIRVAPFDRSAVKLSEYTGDFHSDELLSEYSFAVIDNVLVAQHRKYSDKELYPIKRDVFDGFFGKAKFLRDQDDQIIGLEVSSSRVRNVRFDKKTKSKTE